MNTTKKPGILFWAIAIILGLLWNGYGAWLFVNDAFLSTAEVIDQYPEAIRELMSQYPGWMTFVYGIATLGGLFGAILLCLRKRLAVPVLGISLISVLIYFCYSWIALNSGEVLGTAEGYVVPIVVIVIGIILYLYSKHAAKTGLLS